MNPPLNLNKTRKQRAKSDKTATATENAIKFGRSKAERLLEATKNARAAKMLDQQARDDTP